MRAQAVHGNIHHDLPRCFFCQSPRRVKGAMCSLFLVFVIASIALAISGYLVSQDPALYDSGAMGALKSHDQFEYLEFKVNKLSTELESLQTLLVGSKSPGGPIRNMITDVVSSQLNVYDSDKTGMTDYALENIGGCIASTRDTKTYTEGSGAVTIFGFPIISFASSPKVILQPNTMPGDCWAFEGDRGRVVIKLMTDIIITSMTLEHISRDVSPTGDISSAPKEVALYGLSCLEDEMPHYFGSFTYKDKSHTVQTFQVKHPTHRPYGLVEVYFKSNHGNKLFTCVYRVRIHGSLPDIERDEL